MDAEERLRDRSDRYWQEIDMDHDKFDSREQLVNALEEIELSEMRSFFRDTFLTAERRRLSVRSIGENHEVQARSGMVSKQFIREPESFGRGMEFFPSKSQRQAGLPGSSTPTYMRR